MSSLEASLIHIHKTNKIIVRPLLSQWGQQTSLRILMQSPVLNAFRAVSAPSPIPVVYRILCL